MKSARWFLTPPIVVAVLACTVKAGPGPAEIAPPGGLSAQDDLPPVQPGPDDWPWWLGPNRNNAGAPGQDPPIRWSETENVLWKAEVPGRAHGSPCLWGGRIFLPTADDQAQAQYVLGYDRLTGQELWRTEVHRGGFARSHRKGSHACSTPACDGRFAFMPFLVQGALWLTALDFDGKIGWQTRLGDFQSMHGYGASPAIYKSLVIVAGDSVQDSFLAAVHRRTGQIVWKINRPSYKLGTYASPTIGHVAGRDQLLLHGPFQVYSYDPSGGQRLWSCDGPSDSASATMVFGRDLAYSAVGYPEKNFLCIRADGDGDVTRTHVVWSKRNNMAYVPTPLLADGILYMVEDRGRVVSFDALSGDVIWEARLEGGFSSSPVLAGGHIYAVNEAGATHIFKPGRKFELAAKNDLADGGFATPVICGGRIYLRTLHRLYCLGRSQPAAQRITTSPD